MRVNEIFASLQGEGFWSGTPALFVRFAGCNLRCGFCDTSFESYRDMTAREIADRAVSSPCRHVILTGGEPTLQIDESLLDALHEAGKSVHIETNGTIPLSDSILDRIDWITLSPKDAEVRIGRFDELKVVYNRQPLSQYSSLVSKMKQPEGRLFLQPCDTGDAMQNRLIVADTVACLMENTQWRLSLQTHKILDIR